MDRNEAAPAATRGTLGVQRRLGGSFSAVGLALGTLFFAAALTPTLVPRSPVTQGALAGACLAAGYAIGVALRWLWTYLELPEPGAAVRRLANLTVGALCLAVAIAFLWRAADWQDSIRAVMGMEPVAEMHGIAVCVIAAATFAALLGLARLVCLTSRSVAGRLRFLPRKVANVTGASAALLLFWTLANGVLLSTALRVLDSSYQQFDALMEPERPQPKDESKAGGPASLVRWDELGRAGREFVASGPRADEIAAVSNRPALEPIRVYVGLRAADTPTERARLALRELQRVGGFDRGTLVVITPTGTGWIDPAAIDAVEYLHDGDVASVALQYSYLSSPLSLLVEPEFGADASRALFLEIYRHWITLPKDRRPRFYLHGLSLGALNSEKSAELFELIGDPVQGALWSGPPFGTRSWREITDARNQGSPAWLPQFRDGSFVRFMNQNGFTVPASSPWGPIRIVYLQYASDAVTFFDHRDLYRQPAWMDDPRGPDVSPELTWFPVVTMLQIALDMAVATSTPIGYGHVYAPQHYVDAWVAVTGVSHWRADKLDALKRHLADRAATTPNDDHHYEDRGG